jgi:hypothetical protein
VDIARPRLTHWTIATVAFAALAIVHTWPLATNPAVLSLNDNGDAQLNEWILAWVVHQVAADPVHLFDANIFYPARGSLAFSEPLIVPAVASAPIFWLGGSPVLAYNLLLLSGLVLTALAGYAVVFSWTGDRWGGLLAGSLLAFNTHTLTRLPHLQAVHAYGLPLALLFADRLMRRASVAASLGLAASMTVMFYTSGYLVVFATVALAVAIAVRAGEWWGDRRHVLAGFAGAAAAAAVASLPVIVAYRRVAIEQGMVRSLENVRQFSATLHGYLAAAGRLHASTWSGQFSRNPVDTFFPGIVAALLAAWCVLHAVRTRAHAARVAMLAGIGACGFVLSLGVNTPVYGWLFAAFPPVQGLRAAARFGFLFLLAVAVLAGLGLAAVRERVRWRRGAVAAVSLAAVAAVNAEALRAPFTYKAFGGIPRLYSLLGREPGQVVLAEMPFYVPTAVFRNAEYVLNSTAHWRPLLNGYSGYTPASYRELAATLRYFPRPDAIDLMRRSGVTHFTVHPNRFGDNGPDVLEVLSGRKDVELVAVAAGEGIRLYRFR